VTLFTERLPHRGLKPSSLGPGDLPLDGVPFGSSEEGDGAGVHCLVFWDGLFAGCCLRPGVGVDAPKFAVGALFRRWAEGLRRCHRAKSDRGSFSRADAFPLGLVSFCSAANRWCCGWAGRFRWSSFRSWVILVVALERILHPLELVWSLHRAS
jgi:hypothetical protein